MVMRIKRSVLLGFAAAAAFAGVAHAAPPDASAEAPPSEAPFAVPPVGDARLMRIRGGFDLGNGLLASFGISRMVYINGNLVAQSSVNIPDMSHVTQAQLNALGAALGSLNVVSNAHGTRVVPGSIGQGLGATLIQNSLNNQHIRAATTIDATVKNLGAFNRINLGHSLQSAVINSRSH